jgi:ribose-phosphate pyrophosphokinase
MADFYEAAGADRVMAVDLHTGQIQGFFDVPFDHLTALPMLADHFSEMVDDHEVMIISPDAGGGGWADKWSDHLAEFHGMASQVGFLHKKRRKDARNVSETLAVVGDVKNKTCIVVDDMIDTGGTLTSGVEALLASGAKEVYAAATHAVLSGPAVDRIKNSQLKQLVVTNTLPISDDKTMDKLAVLSIAPTIANTIKAVFEEGSVSELFHGENQP